MTMETSIGELLAEQIERLFSEKIDRNLWISVEQGQHANTLWNELEQLGILTALVSEQQGGAGLSWADAEPSLRAAGRHGAPLPLAEGLLAHWALGNAGIEVPSGPIAISSTILQLDNDDTLNGTDPAVNWAASCKHIVAIAERQQARFVCLLRQSDCQLDSQQTIAREPQSAIHLHNVKPLALQAAAANIGELGLLPYLASLRAIQIGGALEQLLALCVEYGNTREQFGRPIGKFQAIQHAIAELASHSAAAQVAGLYACRQIDTGRAETAAMVAKTRAGQAAGRGAEIAHQVFGAIGFTDEHSLHYFTRRLWQWRSEAGSEFWWAERLGQQTIAEGGQALWPSITV